MPTRSALGSSILSGSWPPALKLSKGSAFYLPSGARQPILLDGSVARPNGLTLTGDGKTLIVDDTLNPTVFAYDVQPDGSVKNKRPFTQLRDIPPGAETGADGMAIDRDDRLYITTAAGVQVFDAKAQYLGTIKAARHAP